MKSYKEFLLLEGKIKKKSIRDLFNEEL